MSAAVADRLREAVRTIQALRGRIAELQAEREPTIAIVGMACRFAGANGTGELWSLLAEGRDAVRPIPQDRWEAARWFSPDADMPGRVAFCEAAFLDEVDGFDNDLFGIAAREAEQMDPQHRILLELTWEALEDAAIRPDRLAGAACGVFLGINGGDHLVATLAAPERIGSHALSGAVGSIAAGRIAYTFGLSGPAIVVDTACSSSLVAVHLAVRALRDGECVMALAGGIHLMLTPNVSVALSRARMMAPDGRCKAFDAAADGFGQGEGGGLVVLKRLADAVADGDRVLAVIAGSALNQDGRSAGITAPSQGAQERVIRAALANAGIEAGMVDAIEAHGTGTALGDPIEMHALKAVFGGRRQQLSAGSIKTNIGHTAAAAGIAGLIKAVLMLHRQAMPPSLHFRRLNPHIELGDAPIAVPTGLNQQRLDCVGVSSFGFSGTNAHVVLRAAPVPIPAAADTAAAPALLISAQTRAALEALVGRYRALLAGGSIAFADICRTALVGRARLPWWVSIAEPGGLATAVPRQGPAPEPDGPVVRRGLVDLPRYPFQHRMFARIRPGGPSNPLAFPGQLIETPSADRQLECVLDLARSPWIAEHRVEGRVVVPGAVMLALLFAVAPPAVTALRDIAFIEPVLLEADPVKLVALMRPDGSLGIASRDAAGWTWHTTARIDDPRDPLQLPMAEPAGWLPRGGWVGHLAALGIEIGPVFQSITRIAPGPLSIAELDPAVAGEIAGLRFHPAVLDAVLQVAGGTLPAEPVLPVGIARLTLRGPLSGPLRVMARRGADGIDVEVSADGRAVATVEGLAVRRLAEGLPPVVATLAWKPAPAAPADCAGAEIFEVAEGGANLAKALALVRRRLHEPAPIAFLTRGATPPVDDPGAALFVGLASALAEERPELRCRCIDIAPGVPDALIEEETHRTEAEPVVALRPAGRFVPRLIPTETIAGEVRLGGTVLISGGLGGIGRHVAGWAAARGAEAVLLVSRRGGVVPPDLPVPARVLAADIAAADAGDRLAAALTSMPPLRTVVHAAGVLRDGLVEALDAGDFAATLGPKLGGAWVLHHLTERLALDHFLLFGSVASLIGAAGQASYAAANATLDAFAEWRRARGLPATAILWGSWAATGMAARLTPAQSARVAARGLLATTPSQALAALDAAILGGASAVMVASLDRAALAATAPAAFAELLPPPVPEVGPVPLQVAAAVRQILGQPAEPGRALVAYGLDSLMAIDLRNRLNRRFGIGLGLGELMGGADIGSLAAAVERAIAANADVEELAL
ncbi:MAG TPA: beta-ketoacyl synthase N-terminal-like domain-containing protein [Stellaceae bacterium]|jgi:acyl transferase domain-containing protein